MTWPSIRPPGTPYCPAEVAGRRRLIYVGRVEWGTTRAVVARIREQCTILSTPLCEGAERDRGVVWIAPDVVAEVTYSESMQGRLRDPSLRAVYATWQRRRPP